MSGITALSPSRATRFEGRLRTISGRCRSAGCEAVYGLNTTTEAPILAPPRNTLRFCIHASRNVNGSDFRLRSIGGCARNVLCHAAYRRRQSARQIPAAARGPVERAARRHVRDDGEQHMTRRPPHSHPRKPARRSSSIRVGRTG